MARILVKSGMAPADVHRSKTSHWAGSFWSWCLSWSWSCKARPAMPAAKPWCRSSWTCRSSEKDHGNHRLQGEHVPKRTKQQYLCASSFFFISAKWATVSAWILVETEQKHVSFARLACLYVLVCVVVLQNENFEGEYGRRPWVNSNSLSKEKNFLRSLNLLRETWERSTSFGRMSLSTSLRFGCLFPVSCPPKGATPWRRRTPILLKVRPDDSPHTTCTCEDSAVMCWNT